MVTNETELKNDVRKFTGYTSTLALSSDGLDTAYRTAKRHIRVRKGLSPDYVWYDSDKPEAVEALFWFTCLFSKVQTGELDSQTLQVGAIQGDTLLAKADDDVTEWYRNAQAALNSLNASGIIQSSFPTRDSRTYTAGDFQLNRSGGSNSNSGPSI